MSQQLYSLEQVRHARFVVGLMVDVLHRAKLDYPALTPWLRYNLDGCVLDNQPRTAAIVAETIGWLPIDDARKEVLITRLRATCAEGPIPYLVADLWQKIADPEDAVHSRTVSDAWFTRFFTNPWLALDSAYTGAPHFLRTVREAAKFAKMGALTGRHDANPESKFPNGMREGTEAALVKHGIPYDHVQMKGDFITDDVVFKRESFRQMIAQGVPPFVYMDNEPSIVNVHREIMARHGLAALSVFVPTTHKTDEPLHPQVVVLKGFSFS